MEAGEEAGSGWGHWGNLSFELSHVAPVSSMSASFGMALHRPLDV